MSGQGERILTLFTNFEGRISRRRYWIGVAILFLAALVWALVVDLVLDATLGSYGQVVRWTNFLAFLVVLYPALALAITRLHDRNKRAFPWAAIFFGPTLLVQFMQASGIGYTETVFQQTIRMTPSPLGGAVSFVATATAVWGLIELGFLRGTRGSNDHGPDPRESP